jgi:predicted membrane metal-binding protein
MLLVIAIVLGVLWLLGFMGRIGGGVIHLLLIAALVMFILNVVSGRHSTDV